MEDEVHDAEHRFAPRTRPAQTSALLVMKARPGQVVLFGGTDVPVEIETVFTKWLPGQHDRWRQGRTVMVILLL